MKLSKLRSEMEKLKNLIEKIEDFRCKMRLICKKSLN